MQKYVLYVNQLDIKNIIDIADTKEEIIELYRMAKIFRKMVGREGLLQMALVEMSDKELEIILGKK